MARPKSVVNVADLDQQIASIGQTIQIRYVELKNELDTLAERYFRITGRQVGTNGSNGRSKAEPSATVSGAGISVTKTKAGKKRRRKQGVDVAWIEENLSKPMTVKQLQDVAEKGGRSGLSVMNVLRAHKGKFKTSPGQKKEGVKGVPAQLYSLK